LSQANSKFESSVRGYDRQQVDSELRRLNAEILRLSTLNQELSAQLKQTLGSEQDTKKRLEDSQNPDYSSLGAQANRILSDAEQIAKRLVSEQNSELEIAKQEFQEQIEARRAELEAEYQKTISDAEKRAKSWLKSSQQEAEQIVNNAKEQAQQLLEETDRDAGRLRGMVATEVAGTRMRAKRELALMEAENEKQLAAIKQDLLEKLDSKSAEKLIGAKKLAALEKNLADQKVQAEKTFKQNADSAIHEAEEYVRTAQKSVDDLVKTKKRLTFEIETLELAAVSENQNQVNAAREKAEAIVHQAELLAAEVEVEASERFREIELKHREKLRKLQQQSDSIEVYIRSLKQKLAGIDINEERDIDAD